MTKTTDYGARRLDLTKIRENSWYIVKTQPDTTTRSVLLHIGKFQSATDAHKLIWRESKTPGVMERREGLENLAAVRGVEILRMPELFEKEQAE